MAHGTETKAKPEILVRQAETLPIEAT